MDRDDGRGARDDGAGLPALTWREVCARRLDRHGLAAPRRTEPADVAADVCGIHAQVPSAAEVSVGVRMPGGTRADVHRALWTDHTLVRTFGPRGTVHLLAGRDLPMWTGALGALPAHDPFPDDVRLTAAQTDEVVEAIGAALADAELTVDELTDALVASTGPWAGERVMPAFGELWPRWRQAVATAAHRGALCFGPSRGRTVTYTNPRRWLPDLRPADPADALGELVTRYLHAYGPATPEQVARWLAAPRGWVVDLFAALGPRLRPVSLQGTSAWLPADDVGDATTSSGSPSPSLAPSPSPGTVRLLPYFDAYVVGCHPRDLLFPGRAADRALTRGQAGNLPVLLVDGTVAGVWHHRRSGRRLEVTVEPFGDLTPAQRDELGAQVERVGEVLEAVPRLTLGTVTVGPHA